MSTGEKPDACRLADQLHSAALHLLRRVRSLDSASGLNAPRLSALSVVVFGGAITLGELARAEQVKPPTMTRIVNALERQGLVAKTRPEDNLRSVRITATVRGRRILLEGRNRRTQYLAGHIQKLEPEERATLASAISLLERIGGEMRTV